MAAGTPSTEAPSKGRALRPLLVGAGLVLSLAAMTRVLDLVIENPMTGVFLGALVVSFVVGRTAVPFASASGEAWRRGLGGAAISAAAVALTVLGMLLLGARLQPTSPSLAIVFGIAESFARAFRDEIWLHGIALAYGTRAGVDQTGVGRAGVGLFATMAPVAAVCLSPGATLAGLVLTGASSAVFVSLWLRGRDGWAPVGAHVVWRLAADSLLAGEVVSVGRGAGRLTAAPHASGPAAWLASALLLIAAGLVFRGLIPLSGASDQELERQTV